ncbi:hypothetical protein PHMEG_0008796 [Phytophthora megakarya]|uniref:Uncharacterized protein n=1 Tax=Phytophthora megakarya TaxID=4795 RepID=A0A225WJV8_9STRA|nr:hypothetical protein PHMEG_0008796 [Phytophthora megakarya]
MRKLRTLKQVAKLRAKTPLVAVLRQDTRWSSTFSLFKLYFRLRGFISADDDDLADLLLRGQPSTSWRQSWRVPKHLQKEYLALLDAQALFDALLDIRSSFSERYLLSTDANIVHSPDFEEAVVKVLDGQMATLMDDELAVVVRFKRIQRP